MINKVNKRGPGHPPADAERVQVRFQKVKAGEESQLEQVHRAVDKINAEGGAQTTRNRFIVEAIMGATKKALKK